MCELLGMSSNHRTSINLSLTTLAERGENPNLHGDGWGVAFYEGRDVRLIKDSGEAKNSEWVEFIKSRQIRSHDVIAHIRKSTIGEVAYKNTHPFIRELDGRIHTFAHNGTMKKVYSTFPVHNFRPVGNTDSEYAFCVLMDRMMDLWNKHKVVPSLDQRLEIISQFAKEMREIGSINFLYSDGETLFAHGHQRHDPITKITSWPGLHYTQVKGGLNDEHFHESSQSGIAVEGRNHLITLFASVPLNEDHWRPLKEGEILAVTKGQIKRAA